MKPVRTAWRGGTIAFTLLDPGGRVVESAPWRGLPPLPESRSVPGASATRSPSRWALTSRQLDIDDIKPGDAFEMADVRRGDAPACGDGRGGNNAVVRSDVRAG